MRIAYIGTKHGTSFHRAKALERLGHTVVMVNPFVYLTPFKWAMKWVYHTGGAGAGLYAYRGIRREVELCRPDLIWVDTGAFLGPSMIQSLRATGVPVINYMIDNAWASIYRIKCRHYRSALQHYDLSVQVRDFLIPIAYAAGAKNVYLATTSADEIVHRPRDLSDEQKEKYRSEVAFIGLWLPERGAIMVELIRRGVPLSIWGNQWTKAPEWKILAPYWRGPALNDAEDYAIAIQSAKICIGLVSKQVKDQYTSRSLEIPALGGLFCAERTTKHCELYKDGEEAVFWDSAEECAEICHGLLANEEKRANIARRGRERALQNGHFNEKEMEKVLIEVRRIYKLRGDAVSNRSLGIC